MKVLSLFDGISCGMVALERAGISVDAYYASEIDKNAIAISQKNYPDIIRLGDVTKWREWDIPWSEIDLLIGGSPCQSLSITQSKTRQGLNGKSKLFFEFVDILNHIKKYNQNVKFLFENVSSMSKESKQAIEECLGVELVYQNSSAFSAQDRGRVYGTNFPFKTILTPSNILLKDVLENEVDEKYFYNCKFDFLGFDKTVCATLHINGHDILKRVNSPFAKCQTLTTCGGGNTQKKVLDNGRPRKLTPLEYERLQTLPDGYTDGFADSHRYNTIGNGWTVDVIAHILKGLNDVLKPCPFCGGEAIAEGRKTIGYYKSDREYCFVNWIVRCTNRECFMSGLRMSAFLDEFLTEEEAIEAWNRRAGERKEGAN